MADPRVSLTVAAALAALVALLLWPTRGWLWRAMAAAQASERTRIEDALKHLYDCEWARVPGTRQHLAEALRLSCARTTRLAGRLVELGLIRAEGVSYRLTAEGRSEALRVVRVHQLWRRYLSDDAGSPATSWYPTAGALEGPAPGRHAAPIDFADRGKRGSTARQLPDLTVGKPAEIVSIKKEPGEVYAQLRAQCLHVGMQIRLIESSPTRVRLDAEGEEVVLAPVVAANVTAVAIVEPGSAVRVRRLSSLAPEQRARVTGLSLSCDGIQRRRLLDLGFVAGTVVEAELRSADRDLTAYRVRGALLALRSEQANSVHIADIDNGELG